MSGSDHVIDVIVIGGGAAGLSAAISAAKLGAGVTVVNAGISASAKASGFNAAVGKNDSPALFSEDILKSGEYINDPGLVAEISRFASDIKTFFDSYGIHLEQAGKISTRLSGGSSVARTTYAEGEQLGAWLITQLNQTAQTAGATLVEGRIYDIVREQTLFKLSGVSEHGERFSCRAKAVVIATGGLGRLYGYTTNFPSSTGMGYMLALRLGATLIDMEFTQFEPFIMLGPGPCRGRGVPINLVADGGRITNSKGNEFIPPSPLGIRAYTKDVLGKIIFTEISEGRGSANGGVYCDVSKAGAIIHKYPGFLKVCESASIDPLLEKIEICPAYHCMMGGIKIDSSAQAGIEGLYAAGEVAGGIHGANRLGSNGLTDALAFGSIAGRSAALYTVNGEVEGRQDSGRGGGEIHKSLQMEALDLREIYEMIGRTMIENVGLARTEQSLLKAATRIEEIRNRLGSTFAGHEPHADPCYIELMSTLDLGFIIINSAMRRRETRGVHYRNDFPGRDSRYDGSFEIKKHNDAFDCHFISRGRH